MKKRSSFLKGIATVFFFVIFGIALGAGAFFLQKYNYPINLAKAVQPSPTPKASPSPNFVLYKDSIHNLTLNFPTSTAILEDSYEDTHSGLQGNLLHLVSKSTDGITLHTLPLTIYVIPTDTSLSTTAFDQAKVSLKRKILTGLQLDYSFRDNATPHLIHNHYLDSLDNTTDYYELTNSNLNLYILATDSSSTLPSNTISTLINSALSSLYPSSNSSSATNSTSPLVTTTPTSSSRASLLNIQP